MNEIVTEMLTNHVKYGSIESYKVLMQMYTPLLLELLEDGILMGDPKEAYTKGFEALQDAIKNYPCDGSDGEDWIHDYVEKIMFPYLDDLNLYNKTEFTDEEIEQYVEMVKNRMGRVNNGEERLLFPYTLEQVNAFNSLANLLSTIIEERGDCNLPQEEFISFASSIGISPDVLSDYKNYYMLRGRQLCEGVPVHIRPEVLKRIDAVFIADKN